MGEVLTDAFKQLLADIQDYSEMAGRSLANLATGPRYFQDILDQMDDIGGGSLPIVLMADFFIGPGMVLPTRPPVHPFRHTTPPPQRLPPPSRRHHSPPPTAVTCPRSPP